MLKNDWKYKLKKVMEELQIEQRYGNLVDGLRTKHFFSLLDSLYQVIEKEELEDLLIAMEKKSHQTYLHSFDVFILMFLLDPQQKIENIRGALFHDIGKLRLPTEILEKQGRLTADEYEIMKRHTTYGEIIMKDLGYEEEALIAKYHHEHVDGTGYFKLKKSELSEVLCLMNIIDVYSALTLKRSYKDSMTNEEAQVILENSHKKYDNDMLGFFTKKCLN